MKNLYIGIDPDVEESGFAIWNKTEKQFEVITALPLGKLLDAIITKRAGIALVVVEAGWLNTGNRHLYRKKITKPVKDPLAFAAKTGENTGRNHQRGMDIVELLEWLEIPYKLQQPSSRNIWKDSEPNFKKITGVRGGNPEKRDAAMLVFQI